VGPSAVRTAAIAYTLIETAKLNVVDPQAWLADILGRILDHKITRIDELMPWRYDQHGRAQPDPICFGKWGASDGHDPKGVDEHSESLCLGTCSDR